MSSSGAAACTPAKGCVALDPALCGSPQVADVDELLPQGTSSRSGMEPTWPSTDQNVWCRCLLSMTPVRTLHGSKARLDCRKLEGGREPVGL